MSYQLDGVYYHSYSEYQRARERRDRLQADSQINALHRQAEHYQQQIRNTNQALREAEGNYQRQLELNQQLNSQVRDLGRTQQELRGAQQAMEQEMERGFREVREHMEQTGEDVAALEQAHQQHVRAVRQQYGELDGKLQAGLRQAEEDRKEMERRLAAEVDRVDKKVEADRAERLRTAKGELDRAAIQIEMSEATLRDQEGRLDVLDLHDVVLPLREQIARARTLHEKKDAAAALAASETAFAQASGLIHQVHRREAVLKNARTHVCETIHYLRGLLQDADCRRYFNREIALLESSMDRVAQRAEQGYQRFARGEIEAAADDKMLERMELQVLEIVSYTPIARQWFIEREDRIEELLTHVTHTYGPLSEDPVLEYEDKEDPKSTRIVKCDFGGAKLNLHLHLNPAQGFTLDGYGHDTNRACSAMAETVLQQLKQSMQVKDVRVDSSNRAGPSRVERPTETPWHNLTGRLQETHRELS